MSSMKHPRRLLAYAALSQDPQHIRVEQPFVATFFDAVIGVIADDRTNYLDPPPDLALGLICP